MTFCWPGSPLGSVAGPGSHRGVVASQPPACRGSPDIGEQKLSVPVATAAPAAAKFRGGGRRAAESPTPPPPPARTAPPPPPREGLGARILVVCRRPLPPSPDGETLCQPEREGLHWGGSPPPLGPAHQLPRLDGGCVPSWVAELRERGA